MLPCSQKGRLLAVHVCVSKTTPKKRREGQKGFEENRGEMKNMRSEREVELVRESEKRRAQEDLTVTRGKRKERTFDHTNPHKNPRVANGDSQTSES